jgi:hypothetical protein
MTEEEIAQMQEVANEQNSRKAEAKQKQATGH